MKNEPAPLKPGDVHSAEVFRDVYEFTAESAPKIVVNPHEVPENFRQLIPLVERWAISCDVRRGDYFDKQPDEDIDTFYKTVEPYVDPINKWLDEQDDDVANWSEAAVHFMYFLKSHCDAYTP